jgi:class 3 adenylate cyclase
VIDRPETRYAWNGVVALAYQVVGEGSIDILYLQGFVSNVDLNWESAYDARFLRGLSELGRLILMDRRGWGCSDRFSPDAVPAFEALIDDLVAVTDAARAKRVVLFASFEHTALALLFAASHPQRVSALVLVDPLPVWIRTEETPWITDEEGWEEALKEIHDEWGTLTWTDGSTQWDPVERDWYARMQRATMTPGSMIAEFRRYMTLDVRDILSAIHVPTLIMSSSNPDTDAGFTAPENGRYLATLIPGAELVEHERAGRFSWLHWYERAEPILAETKRFLQERREEQASLDRVLSTVLFTDIVDSTSTAAVMGDAKWRELLAEHDRIAKGLISRYRGEYRTSTGDGLMATFDGPARAILCAQAFVEAVKPLGIEVRTGAHTGEITLREDGLTGIGVHVAARVAALAGDSEVWASSTVKDLTAGSGLIFEDAGEHELKGVPDRWRLYRVVG